MLEAIILYGKNTMVCDLPHDPLGLQNKLNSIGISLTADHIPLSDEDGNASLKPWWSTSKPLRA